MARDIQGDFGVPVQQSLTIDPDEYGTMNMSRSMLGVVLNVYPADSEHNTFSYQVEDRRAFGHQADVLVVYDGGNTYALLTGVVITPTSPSGVDSYTEYLPRPSSVLVTGEDFDPTMHQIDSNDLDGDWCVVNYLAGQYNVPYISNWWPHSANRYDPATSGEANDTLKQEKRYFSRVNGVETVVTSKGDVVVSTNWANSAIKPGGDPVDGRFSRQKKEGGGNIRVNFKPESSLEFEWNEPPSGIGTLDAPEPEMPQKNPRSSEPKVEEKENTYIEINKETANISLPQDLLVQVGNLVSIKSDSSMILEASDITIGEDAQDAAVLGDQLKSWLEEMTVLTAMGPAKINPADIAKITNFLSTKVVVE